MRKDRTFVAALSALGLVMTVACKKQPQPEPPASSPDSAATIGEHFKCYAIQAPFIDGQNVDLLSQFSHEQVPLGRANNLCAPVIKIVGEERFGSFDGTDLKCYLIQGTDPDVNISLTTAQFGTEAHEVGQAIAACLPANTANVPDNPSQTLTRGPNYLCHLIEGRKPDHGPVDLETRMFPLERAVAVDRPYAICAPAVRNPRGSEEQQQEELERVEGVYPHLKCYGIAGPAINRRVNLRTILGEERNVLVQQPQGFCVSAEKEVLSDPKLPPPPQEQKTPPDVQS